MDQPSDNLPPKYEPENPHLGGSYPAGPSADNMRPGYGPGYGPGPGYGGGYYPPPAPAQPIIIAMQQQQMQMQQQQQQQQPQVVAPTVIVVADSFRAHKSLACFVAWCCNPLFGLIGYILAMVADGTKEDDPDEARRLGKASLGVSVSGIIVTILIVIIVVSVIVS